MPNEQPAIIWIDGEPYSQFHPKALARAKANSNPSGGLEAPERKPDPLQALDKIPKVQRARRGGLAVCVDIIALCKRDRDDDNVSAGAKHLRDCIAQTLGIDDGDRRIRFKYGCCQTAGPEQTIVRISEV